MKRLVLATLACLVAAPALAQYDPYGRPLSGLGVIARDLQTQQRQQGYVDDMAGALRSQGLQSNVPFQGQRSNGTNTGTTFNSQPCYNRCR